jgi:hypothetical protein
MRQPSSLIITDGTTRIPLRGRYMYQRGNIYTLHELRVGENASLRNLAPGIRLHAAFAINGREELLEGKFPPDDELILLP